MLTFDSRPIYRALLISRYHSLDPNNRDTSRVHCNKAKQFVGVLAFWCGFAGTCLYKGGLLYFIDEYTGLIGNKETFILIYRFNWNVS